MATKKRSNEPAISSFEIEELAADLCGIDSDDIDANDIDAALIEKWDITLDQFVNVISAIWPRLAIGISPLTEKAMIGLLNDKKDMWLAKSDITPTFISSVLQWMGADTMKRESKGVSRLITSGGKPEYEIIVKYPVETNKTL